MGFQMGSKQWERSIGDQTFLISTNPDLISRHFVQESFANSALYWAKPLDTETIEIIIKTSLWFGIYIQTHRTPTSDRQNDTVPATLEQIGMARLITDYSTIAYLEDVFVVPQYQGQGLAKWMMRCIQEIIETMPAIRRVMLLAKRAPYAIQFYSDTLGTVLHDQAGGEVVFMST